MRRRGEGGERVMEKMVRSDKKGGGRVMERVVKSDKKGGEK